MDLLSKAQPGWLGLTMASASAGSRVRGGQVVVGHQHLQAQHWRATPRRRTLAMPLSTVMSTSAPLSPGALGDGGGQAVAVDHAVGHHVVHALRAPSRRRPRSHGAGGGAVAVVVGHDAQGSILRNGIGQQLCGLGALSWCWAPAAGQGVVQFIGRLTPRAAYRRAPRPCGAVRPNLEFHGVPSNCWGSRTAHAVCRRFHQACCRGSQRSAWRSPHRGQRRGLASPWRVANSSVMAPASSACQACCQAAGCRGGLGLRDASTARAARWRRLQPWGAGAADPEGIDGGGTAGARKALAAWVCSSISISDCSDAGHGLGLARQPGVCWHRPRAPARAVGKSVRRRPWASQVPRVQGVELDRVAGEIGAAGPARIRIPARSVSDLRGPHGNVVGLPIPVAGRDQAHPALPFAGSGQLVGVGRPGFRPSAPPRAQRTGRERVRPAGWVPGVPSTGLQPSAGPAVRPAGQRQLGQGGLALARWWRAWGQQGAWRDSPPWMPQSLECMQNLPYEWRVGWRYTRARARQPSQRFISSFPGVHDGHCAGVAALIIVLSVMNGFQRKCVTACWEWSRMWSCAATARRRPDGRASTPAPKPIRRWGAAPS